MMTSSALPPSAIYRRWAAMVPAGFAVAVKAPKRITHELHLMEADEAINEFLAQVDGLGAKLGPLLFQLPPSLAFDAPLVRSFFSVLRVRFAGSVVCEPRHPGWFTEPATNCSRRSGSPALRWTRDRQRSRQTGRKGRTDLFSAAWNAACVPFGIRARPA